MPSRESNTLFQCGACQEVYDFDGAFDRTTEPCPNCGRGPNWTGIRVQTVCDFCSKTLTDEEAWVFYCPDFPYDYVVINMGGSYGEGSKGNWTACEECKDLIVANDQPALTKRCLDVEEASDPAFAAHRHVFASLFKAIHKGFFKHKFDRPPEKGVGPDG